MKISEFGLRTFCVSTLALSAVFCGVASVCAAQPVVSKEDKAAAIAQMTDGVVGIVKSGLPGPVATLGDSAFPVVVAEYEKGVSQPLVSAAFTGE